MKMKFKLIVEVNNEMQEYDFWDYCQALTAAIKLNNRGYKTRIEKI